MDAAIGEDLQGADAEPVISIAWPDIFLVDKILDVFAALEFVQQREASPDREQTGRLEFFVGPVIVDRFAAFENRGDARGMVRTMQRQQGLLCLLLRPGAPGGELAGDLRRTCDEELRLAVGTEDDFPAGNRSGAAALVLKPANVVSGERLTGWRRTGSCLGGDAERRESAAIENVATRGVENHRVRGAGGIELLDGRMPAFSRAGDLIPGNSDPFPRRNLPRPLADPILYFADTAQLLVRVLEVSQLHRSRVNVRFIEPGKNHRALEINHLGRRIRQPGNLRSPPRRQNPSPTHSHRLVDGAVNPPRDDASARNDQVWGVGAHADDKR